MKLLQKIMLVSVLGFAQFMVADEEQDKKEFCRDYRTIIISNFRSGAARSYSGPRKIDPKFLTCDSMFFEDIHPDAGSYENSFLHVALTSGFSELAEELIDHREKDINIRDSEGNSPLFTALRFIN